MHNVSGYSSFLERKQQENKDFNFVVDFFKNSGYTVNDVHEDARYFNKDIDIIVAKDGNEKSIEIKFDDYMHKTNNFFFEIISNEEISSPGCFLKSEADILLYYDTVNKIGYEFWMQKMKKRFFEVRNKLTAKGEIDKNFKLQSTHTKGENRKYHHTTIGRLVNKDYLFKLLDKDNIGYKIIEFSGKNKY